MSVHSVSLTHLMNCFIHHRPLWLAALATGIVMGLDVFWLFKFMDMQHPHAELADRAVRLGFVYGLVIAPAMLAAYALAVWSLTLALCGRRKGLPKYSSASRILSVLLCAAVFGFHHLGLWRVILMVHAARHPELLNL